MNETDYETFVWCGQTRYRCNRKWANGTACAFDTYDPALMDEHIRAVHVVKRPVAPAMPTLFDAEGNQVQRAREEEGAYRWAPEKIS